MRGPALRGLDFFIYNSRANVKPTDFMNVLACMPLVAVTLHYVAQILMKLKKIESISSEVKTLPMCLGPLQSCVSDVQCSQSF